MIKRGAMPPKQYQNPPALILDPGSLYSATIKTSLGDMTLQLLPAEAPRTVNNFVFLARDGFYDGGGFHRIINEFMIQGGCPKGDGTGGPGYRFPDEEVKRPYVKGTLAMANAGPDTNGSQFFIVHGASVGLPPNYTIFGQLISGEDILDKLATVPVTSGGGGEQSKPTDTLEIITIEITEEPIGSQEA
jgi:cyclophilin family peptidyl-prolyl cis-trans isomerase